MDKISLAAARVNSCLSQKEAAVCLGVSNKTLSKWERGASFPSVEMIPKICALYGRPYDGIKFLPDDSL